MPIPRDQLQHNATAALGSTVVMHENARVDNLREAKKQKALTEAHVGAPFDITFYRAKDTELEAIERMHSQLVGIPMTIWDDEKACRVHLELAHRQANELMWEGQDIDVTKLRPPTPQQRANFKGLPTREIEKACDRVALLRFRLNQLKDLDARVEAAWNAQQDALEADPSSDPALQAEVNERAEFAAWEKSEREKRFRTWQQSRVAGFIRIR